MLACVHLGCRPHAGEEKYKYPWYKLWILTIIAGCYVGT